MDDGPKQNLKPDKPNNNVRGNASANKNWNDVAMKRLKRDYLILKKEPLPYIFAEPNPANMLEWHYILKGPENTPYFGGFYHGKVIFPDCFPFKPPSILMLTPSGRFKTNTRLCLSISDFHPDTWNPTWSTGTILQGLLSFMVEDSPTLGAIESTETEKQQFAAKSLEFNLKQKIILELFPELCQEMKESLRVKKAQESELIASTSTSTSKGKGRKSSRNKK